MRDTIARVFENPAYSRSAQQTIAEYLFELIGRAISRLIRALAGAGRARDIILWVVIALAVLIIVRILYVAIAQDRLRASRQDSREPRSRGESAWTGAQRAAAAGDYTQAAHLLYAALLQTLAQRERVKLHSSKTAGDYARELRARSSPLWSPFRKFVQAFEFVAYGRRECSRDEFERLRDLAEPVMGGQA